MARKVLNGNIDGNGFDKNPENINRKGRPRKTISAVNIELEKEGYTEATKADIVSCYMRLIQLTDVELKEKVDDESQPILIKTVGKAIQSGKGFDVIEKILDRGIGKVDQGLDHKSSDGTMSPQKADYSNLNDDDIIKLSELNKKAKGL